MALWWIPLIQAALSSSQNKTANAVSGIIGKFAGSAKEVANKADNNPAST